MMYCDRLGNLQRLSTYTKEPCVVGKEGDLFYRLCVGTVGNILGAIGFYGPGSVLPGP